MIAMQIIAVLLPSVVRSVTVFSAALMALIEFYDGSFFNRDTDLVRGMDINATFEKDFSALERAMTLTVTGRANHLLNRSTIDLDDDGNVSLGSFHGEFGFPKWTGRMDTNLEIDGKWDLFWRVRYISSVAQDDVARDEFADVFGRDNDWQRPC